LKDNLGARVTTPEFDKAWTKNMYGFIIWKLAAYSLALGLEHSLSLFNILH